MVKSAKLDVMGMAKAGGAMGVLFAAAIWIGMQANYGMGLSTMMMELYRGFNATVLGLLIGLVWGALDWGIGAAFFAWVYNKVSV